MAKKPVILPNADLWGLNPRSGRLYSTRERRDMLHDRGIRGNVGGPLPSRDWDEYNDRYQGVLSGLPQDFNAGDYTPKSLTSINNALMANASARDADFAPGPIMSGMPDSPNMAFTGAGADLHMRPSMKPLQGYGGYGKPDKARAKKQNEAGRAAQFHPYAGK